MSRYRRMNPADQNAAWFRDLDDDAKLVNVIVQTHPSMTALGAMRATAAGLSAELGWPVRRAQRALDALVAAGRIEMNAGAAYIGVPSFLEVDAPSGPNSTGAWKDALGLVPDCQERRAQLRRCVAYLERQKWATPDDVLTALRDGCTEPSPEPSPHPSGEPSPHRSRHPSPTPEPEVLPGTVTGSTPQPPKGGADGRPWLDLLNRETGAGFKAAEGNLRPIRARIREGHTLDEAEAVVTWAARTWQGTPRAEYLRPGTLFGPKFDGYLQATRNGHSNGHGINDAWKGEQGGEVRP